MLALRSNLFLGQALRLPFSFFGGRSLDAPSPDVGASASVASTSVVVAVSRLSGNVHTGGVHVSNLSGNVHTGGLHVGFASSSPSLLVAMMATSSASTSERLECSTIGSECPIRSLTTSRTTSIQEGYTEASRRGPQYPEVMIATRQASRNRKPFLSELVFTTASPQETQSLSILMMSEAMTTEAYANTNNTDAFPTELTVPDQDRKVAGIEKGGTMRLCL